MYAKGGILPGYEKSVPTQGGSSGGGGGGGGFGGGSSGGSNTGSGRFAIYDYTARFGDKFWEVSRDDLNGKIVASDNNNSNVGSVNQQLARDWIENDRKRRLAEEQGSGSGDGDDGSSGGSSSDDDDDGSSFPGLTDNQRFLLIGLVVVGLFAKKVM